MVVAVVKTAEARVVKGMCGADLVAKAEDTERSWFQGVKVKFCWFKWGEVFDGEVFWEVFDREAGRIVGHSMGSLGLIWRVFICIGEVAD